MPLFALLLLAIAPQDLVPMRWGSSDPKSLDLLKGTPVNCILLERSNWSPGIVKAASAANMQALGVVRPASDAVDAAQQAAALSMAGVVLEGDFDAPVREKLRKFLADSKLLAVELPARSRMRIGDDAPIIGTWQGVWPGIQVEEGGSTKAAPSGAPWIDTNTGFLRFVRSATDATIWIANTPPKKTVVLPERYMQVIADAAISGGRWVVALDDNLNTRLLSREPNALRDWKRISDQLAWYELHPEWRRMKVAGQLALVQDVDSGALLSGGVLDMIAVKHTPVRPVPTRKLSDTTMKDSKMAVDVDASSLTPEQKQVLARFTRGGGRLLTGPPGWKFPAPQGDQITLGEKDIKVLDEICKETNSLTGRTNLGARLFNVSSMLSNLLVTPDGKQTILHLVNYSDYPVENVTVHMLGKFKSAQLLSPGSPAKQIAVYDVEEGTGVDIDKVAVSATLVLE
jgi:hypothetical protein